MTVTQWPNTKKKNPNILRCQDRTSTLLLNKQHVHFQLWMPLYPSNDNTCDSIFTVYKLPALTDAYFNHRKQTLCQHLSTLKNQICVSLDCTILDYLILKLVVWTRYSCTCMWAQQLGGGGRWTRSSRSPW